MGSGSFTPCRGRYSCETAGQTLEWMSAIAAFLGHFRHLIDAHVVNFFKDRLWESVDGEWMECLRKEPIQNLLRIPSGFVMEHWPDSLQKFVSTVDSLAMPRDQGSLNKLFPDMEVTSLDTVLVQGMNPKKKHEIRNLAALVNAVAHNVGAEEIMDVGAGQGYLAQVLYFQYQHRVTAIDASAHHSAVTTERAERIKKHYAAKLLKHQSKKKHLHGPQSITCQILSSTGLSTLITRLPMEVTTDEKAMTLEDDHLSASLVLAGLHACGDLSVNMLRAFVESDRIKAVVCIGCCYNLLSEECPGAAAQSCGFPMSIGAKSHGITLGKNARDLSCQCADRWRNLSDDDAFQNFHLHAFRAAFQMILDRYFPEVLTLCPSIGRQGKAMRRRQMRRVLHSKINDNESSAGSLHNRLDCCQSKDCALSVRFQDPEAVSGGQKMKIMLSDSDSRLRPIDDGHSCSLHTERWRCGFTAEVFDRYKLFEDFCHNGMQRLGLKLSANVDIHDIWSNAQPFLELVGPFWSLRAALGPLLETYLLLDRLLFLQEHSCSEKIMMFPLFDPALSPRNVVIVAQK